jgi:hypothetical protein
MLAVAFSLIAAPAFATEIGAEGELLSVDVHAFASQGFILTSGSNYLANDTKHGSFQFSEVGINFTKSLTDKLRMGLQLFAQDLGPTGNYNARVDWFYLDYRHNDWLGFRAGRVKTGFELYGYVRTHSAGALDYRLYAGTIFIDSATPAVNAHWLVKLEAHYMAGTAALPSALNDNVPLGALARNWAVFLAKTTAYF